jgi:hypothetical protein
MIRGVCLAAVAATVLAGNPLGPYKIDPSKVCSCCYWCGHAVRVCVCLVGRVARFVCVQITVGGLSSGAFFAVQYHVAHSATISGAAVFAGGPYYCAQDTEVYGEADSRRKNWRAVRACGTCCPLC